MPEEDDNASNNFRLYKNKKSILEKQNIEDDPRDLVYKSLDTKSQAKDMLSGRFP